MRSINDKSEFFQQAIEATLDAFQCDGVIVIPVYSSEEKSPAGVTIPVLHGHLEPESVDSILKSAGDVAMQNLQKRQEAKQKGLATDLTPTFTPTPHPCA